MRKYTAYDNVAILLAQIGQNIRGNSPVSFQPNHFSVDSASSISSSYIPTAYSSIKRYEGDDGDLWKLSLGSAESIAYQKQLFSNYFSVGQYVTFTGTNGIASTDRRRIQSIINNDTERVLFINKYDDVAGDFTSKGIKFHSANSNLYNLPRVQSSSYSININRETINQVSYNNSAARKIVAAPEVNLEVEYLNSSENVDSNLGLYIGDDKTCIYNIYRNDSKDERSILFLHAPHQGDREINLATSLSGCSVLGLGNCFLNSYSVNASVGDFLSTSVSWSASNIQFDNCNDVIFTGQAPSIETLSGLYTNHQPFLEVTPRPYTLERGADGNLGNKIFEKGTLDNYTSPRADAGLCRDIAREYKSVFSQGDMSIVLSSGQFGQVLTESADRIVPIQSFSLDLPISRNPLLGFGSNYVFGRKITLPIVANLSLSILKTEVNKGAMYDLFSEDRDYTFEVDLNHTTPDRNTTKGLFTYRINNAKLTSKNYSLSVGNREQVDISFEVEVDTNSGIFIIDPLTRRHDRGFRCC